MASTHIDYNISILLTDQVEIHTKVATPGNKSLEMVQEIIKTGETKPAAVGKMVMVCFDMPTRTSAEIPSFWKENINKYENG